MSELLGVGLLLEWLVFIEAFALDDVNSLLKYETASSLSLLMLLVYLTILLYILFLTLFVHPTQPNMIFLINF